MPILKRNLDDDSELERLHQTSTTKLDKRRRWGMVSEYDGLRFEDGTHVSKHFGASGSKETTSSVEIWGNQCRPSSQRSRTPAPHGLTLEGRSSHLFGLFQILGVISLWFSIACAGPLHLGCTSHACNLKLWLLSLLLLIQSRVTGSTGSFKNKVC
jgi:hypothetical protein